MAKTESPGDNAQPHRTAVLLGLLVTLLHAGVGVLTYPPSVRWNRKSVGVALWAIFTLGWSVLAIVYVTRGDGVLAVLGVVTAVGSWAALVLRLKQETSPLG